MYMFDTNILIDYLKGFEQSSELIEATEKPKISIITWMEVLVGTTSDNRADTEDFLKDFDVLQMNQDIANLAINIRQNY